MSCLRNHGFVKTKEGIGGGYILDCNSQEVSLADIYRIVSRGSLNQTGAQVIRSKNVLYRQIPRWLWIKFSTMLNCILKNI